MTMAARLRGALLHGWAALAAGRSRASRLRGTAVWLLIAASVCMAGGLAALPSSVATAASIPEVTGATLASTPAPDAGVAFLGSDPKECVWQDATLATVPDLSIAGGNVVAKRKIANASLPCSRMVALARWAAITDQRRDVLDLHRGDVLRILRGEANDWSDVGGSPQPISVYLPASQAGAIAAGLGIPLSELAAELLPDDELTDRVESTPGAFALIEPERLRLGVLALTVSGYDPYRDPARLSPLRLLGWVRAPTAEDASALLAAAGIKVAPTFDPVGMLVTGELIPVRCTNHVLAALDDYGAMFDRVRDAIVAADIAVAPLESALTDLGGPTPCVETLVLQGSPRVVPALSDAGVDVVLTIGNHMLDCWGGCSRAGALFDTLTRLHEVGIATAGAGKDLEAARRPTVVSVETAQGPVRFAFLGYDSIAPWYAAGDETPGTAPLSAESVREDVSAARALADHVVIGAGWGVEYTSNPIASQREIGGIAIEAGASFVMGNHPHWVQAVEHFDGEHGALVAYSFGNFIFDQKWSVATTQGMLMELGFTSERLIGYRIRPVVIRAHSSELPWAYRPEFVDPAGEGRPILNRIWNAQDRLPSR